MSLRKIFLFIFLMFSLIVLTGCNDNFSEDLKSKVVTEVKYLDSKIVEIMNMINGLSLQNYMVETKEIALSKSQEESRDSSSQNEKSSNGSNNSEQSSNSEDQDSNKDEKIYVSEMKTNSVLLNDSSEIDWETIKSEIETLYNTWDTIILDLYKLNIPTENVIGFSESLNDTIINLKNENKIKSLQSLANLYSYLPKFLEYSANEKEMVSIESTKVYLINAYSMVESELWDDISREINLAIDTYVPIVSNLKFVKGKEHFVNRTYVILNELKNSLHKKDKDIFYINYKNLMNELNIF